MRIPLDLYRILSVPIKATPQQLEQAFGDRTQQQPRREYGKQAISARLTLIQNAYHILSDPDSRAKYDAQFFVQASWDKAQDSSEPQNLHPLSTSVEAETEELTSVAATSILSEPPQVNPTIEVSPKNFVGALLIFHELGEYELVLKLGLDYLSSAEYANLQKKLEKEAKIAHKSDIILSLALAYLELGREQWHRREYENAALSGHMGLELLIQESLFPTVKEEIELDLSKLKPYRILELIAQNPVNSPERAKGFELLREMLSQRQGIEGKGEDHSGLTFDQFLCFIQQLRTYLTSDEQENLFATESQYDSAIASYLAVYVLLARGFVLKQPELILRAQNLLKDLSQRQDVYWEQAMCALLLGHTHKAIDTVKKSQERTIIELIQQQDPGNMDLLPGLCLYGEKWLQEEVLDQFCDLESNGITLKEYFADREVQSYLEQLSSGAATAQKPVSQSIQASSTNSAKKESQGFFARWRHKFFPEAQVSLSAESEPKLVGVGAQATKTASAILEPNPTKLQAPRSTSSSMGDSQLINSSISTKSSPKHLSTFSPNQPSVNFKTKTTSLTTVKKSPSNSANKTQRTQRHKKRSKSTLITGWLFLATMVLSLGGLGFLTMKILLKRSLPTVKRKTQLTIAVNKSTIELPKTPPAKTAPQPAVNFNDRAKKVIQTWLNSKSAAFGKEHKINELNKILAAPLLTTWRDRALAYQQGNFYREYDHSITMRSAKIDPNDSKKAIVEAEVKEVAKHYQGGKLDSSLSYDDKLLVRYQLIRQGDKWLIQNAEVLKTL